MVDLDNANAVVACSVESKDGGYPSQARSQYRCQVVNISGEDGRQGEALQGVALTFEPVPSFFVEATNEGLSVPPAGSLVLLLRQGEDWAFRY